MPRDGSIAAARQKTDRFAGPTALCGGQRRRPWPALALLTLLAACAAPPPGAKPVPSPVPAEGNCLDRLKVYDMDYKPVADGGSAACPIRDAVEVTRVGQAKLSRPAVMTCALAEQLSAFEGIFVQPAAARTLGSPVTTIHHYGTYACRRATGKASRMSEHAKANAIDIGIFETAKGDKVSVARHWNGRDAYAEFLKQVGQGACTLFTGVLGPDSDSAHRDHFHFDMGPWAFCQLNPVDPRKLRK
ncbi:conserved exported hypothetical protein [uncultured Alphaproteobacteria bacterium]|uniref:Extensin-like C-terminal domain-containing protein n=1 Tax=uncultured Alphaproteobacteria bacterium TaxID=91750 RepID=A0A212KLK8_9PROT|nr:conserved exported hypothetical protein [uncultured Alphaproteobacteria bacterium]